jgi:hypothetical protein
MLVYFMLNRGTAMLMQHGTVWLCCVVADMISALCRKQREATRQRKADARASGCTCTVSHRSLSLSPQLSDPQNRTEYRNPSLIAISKPQPRNREPETQTPQSSSLHLPNTDGRRLTGLQASSGDMRDGELRVARGACAPCRRFPPGPIPPTRNPKRGV